MTNATIRYASGRPADQRGRVLRYWTAGRRREFVEVAVIAGATMTFARIAPNTVWVRVVPSEKKPGVLIVSRTGWLVPDAGAVEDAQDRYKKEQFDSRHEDESES